jgi:hypothetical protein
VYGSLSHAPGLIASMAARASNQSSFVPGSGLRNWVFMAGFALDWLAERPHGVTSRVGRTV